MIDDRLDGELFYDSIDEAIDDLWDVLKKERECGASVRHASEEDYQKTDILAVVFRDDCEVKYYISEE